MARFERLLIGVCPASTVNWADAAAEYGYFDQSHLIRDFRDFAGMTPGAYFARKTPEDHLAVQA